MIFYGVENIGFAKLRAMRGIRASVVYVPTCQKRVNFSFLRANVLTCHKRANVPKACQLFNLAYQRASFSIWRVNVFNYA